MSAVKRGRNGAKERGGLDDRQPQASSSTKQLVAISEKRTGANFRMIGVPPPRPHWVVMFKKTTFLIRLFLGWLLH